MATVETTLENTMEKPNNSGNYARKYDGKTQTSFWVAPLPLGAARSNFFKEVGHFFEKVRKIFEEVPRNFQSNDRKIAKNIENFETVL